MGCCPSSWWCTPTGPAEVEPDGDGIATPPEGATGGPYATFEEAVEECPYPLVEALCPECETPYQMPENLVVAFVNRTGELVGLLPNSIALPGIGPTGESLREWHYNTPNLSHNYHAYVQCQEDGSVRFWFHVILLGGSSILQFNGIDSATGWVWQPGTGTTWVEKLYECGEQIAFDEFVGTVTFTGGDTADVYLVN